MCGYWVASHEVWSEKPNAGVKWELDLALPTTSGALGSAMRNDELGASLYMRAHGLGWREASQYALAQF